VGIIRNPYGSASSFKELDIREELNRTLYGASDEVAKGRVGLLRRMRRDDNNKLIRCPCRDALSDEPDRDYYCRSCLGHGYLWDEVEIVYYNNSAPFSRAEGKVQDFNGEIFYTEYDNIISPEDYLVEIKTDNSGKPRRPVTREKYYNIQDAKHLRCDVGRAEFWQIRAKYQRPWSVWYGVENRQTS